MSGFHEVFPARMEALARVLTLAEAAGAAAGFDRRDTLRLTLVLEELFTNTVAHGHGGDSDAPVGVALDAERGRVALTYEDTGPHFDLVAAAAARADEPPAEARAPGGLGLVLIARLVTDLQYTRAGDRNRISLSVRASPP